jgi:L-asparaginase
VAYGVPEWYRGPVGKNTVSSEFSVDKNTVLPRVDIIMASENMDGALINAAADGRSEGDRDRRRGQWQHDEVRARRAGGAGEERNRLCTILACRHGERWANVEVDDDKLGLIASLDHNPQKSRVLLRLALLKTTDLKTIQRYFDEY